MRCEGCDTAEATEEVEDTDDAARPFRVCVPCARRLVSFALRPREWFRLAVRHGAFAYALHDDFYDDDGTAAQPQVAVEDPAAHPFPTRDEWAHDSALAFEVALVKWRLPADVAEVLRGDVPGTLARLAALEAPGPRVAGLEIAAALGPPAAPWVRGRWAADEDVGLLAHATAECLPPDEAFERILRGLERVPAERFARDGLAALAYVRDPRALDVIERIVTSPVSESFGRLAAASRPEWPRLARWLASGRPMSLVALDALLAIARPDTPLLRSMALSMSHPPSGAELARALDAVLANDDVPRVRRAVESIRASASLLASD